MKERKKLYIITLIVFIIAIVIVKEYYAPKNRIEKLNRNINNIKEDVEEINNSIADYYKGKKLPKYVFLDPKITPKIKKLIKEKLTFQHQLAEVFELKGDYYLYEEYLSDKNPPITYDRLSQNELLHYIKKKDSLAKKTIKKLISSRMLSLKSYSEATKALEDETSDIYEIIKNTNALSVNRIGIKKNWSNLALALSLDRLLNIKHKLNKTSPNKNFRKEYLYNRVKPSLHHKKGIIYRQLSYFTSYDPSILKEDQKKYLDNAEKEFLIAIGVDSKYYKGIYNLAELYVYRYEHFNDYKKHFYLEKAEELLKRRVDLSVKNGFGGRDKLSWFLLGRIYYLMDRLDEAMKVYKNRLMAILPENSISYKNAEKNYLIIQNELTNNIKIK